MGFVEYEITADVIKSAPRFATGPPLGFGLVRKDLKKLGFSFDDGDQPPYTARVFGFRQDDMPEEVSDDTFNVGGGRAIADGPGDLVERRNLARVKDIERAVTSVLKTCRAAADTCESSYSFTHADYLCLPAPKRRIERGRALGMSAGFRVTVEDLADALKQRGYGVQLNEGYIQQLQSLDPATAFAADGPIRDVEIVMEISWGVGSAVA